MEGSSIALDVEVLSDLAESIDDITHSILKIDLRTAILAFEKKMSSTITKAWKQVAKSALVDELRKLLSGKLTTKSINIFLAGLGTKMETPLTIKQREVVTGRLRSIYRLSKKEAAREAKGSFNFALRDARAIASTSSQQIFWVNGFYKEELSNRIKAVTKDIILRRGYSYREAGKTLHKALKKELGLGLGNKPSQFAPEVPAKYAGNPEFYFQQVSSVAGHQARVFGKLRAFSESGIATFELINPMDERTGQICLEVHGTVFSVDVGVDRMEAIIGAKTPEEVKRQAPWLSGKILHNALEGTQRGSAAASEKLRELNVVLPPLHPFCRTEIVIVS